MFLTENQTMEPPMRPVVKDEFDLRTLFFDVSDSIESCFEATLMAMKKIVVLKVFPQNRNQHNTFFTNN